MNYACVNFQPHRLSVKREQTIFRKLTTSIRLTTNQAFMLKTAVKVSLSVNSGEIKSMV